MLNSKKVTICTVVCLFLYMVILQYCCLSTKPSQRFCLFFLGGGGLAMFFFGLFCFLFCFFHLIVCFVIHIAVSLAYKNNIKKQTLLFLEKGEGTALILQLMGKPLEIPLIKQIPYKYLFPLNIKMRKRYILV